MVIVGGAGESLSSGESWRTGGAESYKARGFTDAPVTHDLAVTSRLLYCGVESETRDETINLLKRSRPISAGPAEQN